LIVAKMSGMGNNERMGVDGTQKTEQVEIAGLLPATVPETKIDVAGGAEDKRLQNWSRELVFFSQGLGWLVYEANRTTQRNENGPHLAEFTGNKFWFDHIGDVYETTLMMWGTRGLIEVTDLLMKRGGKDGIDPRVKMWLSVIVGMGIPIAVESLGLHIGGNTPDGFDSLGPLVCGILAGSTWELTNFLADGETWIKAGALRARYGRKFVETDTFIRSQLDQGAKFIEDKSSRVGKALDNLGTKVNEFGEKMNDWDPNKPLREYLSKIEAWSDRAAEALVRILAERFAKK
jgi:hypothetical protein